MIKVFVTNEIEITPEDYNVRLGFDKLWPAYNLGDLVEFIGDYKQPRIALIVGVSSRDKCWTYEGLVLTAHGNLRVGFSDKDVTKVVLKGNVK